MPGAGSKTRCTSQATLTTTLAGAFLACTCLGLGLHGWNVRRLRADAAARHLRKTVHFLAAQGSVLADSTRDFDPQPWVEASATRLDAALIGLVNNDGQLLAVHPSDRRFHELYAQSADKRPDLVRTVLCQKGGKPTSCLLSSAVVLHPTQSRPIATLVLALPESSIVPPVSGWGYGLLLIVSFAGIWMAVLVLLSRKIVEPLRRLAGLTSETLNDGIQDVPRSNREILRITQLFEELADEIHNWRSEASDLKYTVETRVDARTRRITSALSRAEKRSWTDALTGCWNRRVLDERLQAIVNAQREAGQHLALAIFDVDNFKALNDSLGHQAGDELLAFVGQLLRTSIRDEDLAVRYGGDEFILVLLGTTAQQAAKIVDRILSLFRQRAPLVGVEQQPSLSVGVVATDQHNVKRADQLLTLADNALYEAKKSGKNTARTFAQLQPANP
jgi:diguanylate cyclase (GGDEF)-like protein